MDLKITEYVRGASISLEIDNAPMVSLKALVASFITAVIVVGEQQKAEAEPERGCGHQHIPNAATEAAMQEVRAMRGPTVPGHPDYRETVEQQPEAADAPKRRGRPRKVAGETPAVAEDKETGNADTTPDASSVASSTEEASPISPTSAETTGEPESGSTPRSTEPTTDEELPEVTDTELQRFCKRVAEKFGDAQKVFALTANFVPEGAVPRPTNIRDNVQRWAFIKAGEAASGVMYHG